MLRVVVSWFFRPCGGDDMVSEIGTMKSIGAPSLPAQTDSSKATAANREPELTKGPVRQAEAQAPPGGRSPEDEAGLADMVSDLGNLVRGLHRELRFAVDRESGETVIKVVDKETDEVIRQIPSQEFMELRKRLQDAAGVIFQDFA
jgi:flagellar protein FlaG